MTSPLQLKWFRVEQAADGSILSCEEVDAKGRRGAHVRYYEAVDKAAACSAAKEWHERHKAQGRARNKRRRQDPIVREADIAAARRRQQSKRDVGLCASCGVNPLSTGWYCEACSSRKSEARRRRLDGLPPLPRRRASTEVTPEHRRAKLRRAAEESKARNNAIWGSRSAYDLACMLRHFDSMPPAQFRTYLIGRITKIGGVAAAKALADYEAQRAEELDRATSAQYKRASKANRRAA